MPRLMPRPSHRRNVYRGRETRCLAASSAVHNSTPPTYAQGARKKTALVPARGCASTTWLPGYQPCAYVQRYLIISCRSTVERFIAGVFGSRNTETLPLDG